MATVSHLLRQKGSHVHTVPATASVLDAVRYMNQHRIGCVVVTQRDRVVGIFTERDVLRRVVEQERRPAEIPIVDVMSEEVICCSPATPIEEASRIMKDHRIRHLPVCNDSGDLVGLISIGDINAFHASDQEATIHFLHEYLYGYV